MADDRNRREDVDDYRGADPGRITDQDDEPIGMGEADDIRGIADEGGDEFEDVEDLEDEDEEDEY